MNNLILFTKGAHIIVLPTIKQPYMAVTKKGITFYKTLGGAKRLMKRNNYTLI